MKRLTVTYGGLTLVDSDVAEFGWQDSEGQVIVNAKWKSEKAAPAGGGLGDLISNLSRQRTQSVVDRKRQEAAEPVVVEGETLP